MTPRTVPIVCARAPRHIVYVPAVREVDAFGVLGRVTDETTRVVLSARWRCSFCGARVRVVA